MRIGIVDDYLFRLQSRLLSEGHEIFVYAGINSLNGFKQPGPEGTVTPVFSIDELIEKNCALYITPGTDSDFSYEIFKSLGFPTIGWSGGTIALEHNRSYAKRLFRSAIQDLAYPEVKEFHCAAGLRAFLLETDRKWVLKQNAASPQEISMNRTLVVHDVSQVLSLFDKPNAWFYPDGEGGAMLEEFRPGQEVCFGAWFNGTQFVEPMYSCIEHKGAQDGDRGGILTGEVGTPLKFHPSDEKSRVWRIFRQLETVLRKTGCHGLVDLNTILDPNTGELFFLEATMRFGRPTLEVILAALKPNFDFGSALHALAKGQLNPLHGAFTDQYAVGVSVFSYGYPMLQEAAPKDYSTKHLLTDGIRFVLPRTDPKKANAGQFFASWNSGEACWETMYNERQFVVTGFGFSPQEAIQHAYEPLKGYWLLGHTWRNDVGWNLDNLYRFLAQFEVI